jgi:hypothetical protein
MNDILYDYKNKSINKISFMEEKSDNNFRKLIFIYDNDSKIPLHPFIIKIDNAKLLEKHDDKIIICLSSNNLKLINFTKELDTIIDKEILKKKGSNTLEIKNTIPFMSISFNSSSHMFDVNGDNVKLKDIKLKSTIQLIIELEYISIKNTCDTKNWKVLQLQEIKTIDLSKSVFQLIDSQKQVQQVQQVQQIQKIQQIQQVQQVQQIPELPPPPILTQKPEKPVLTRTILTMEELLNAKSKLKKRTSKKKSDVVNDSIKTISPLKKVITKEPLSGIDLMKLEQQQQNLKTHIDDMCNSKFITNINDYNIFINKHMKKYKKYEKIFNYKPPLDFHQHQLT